MCTAPAAKSQFSSVVMTINDKDVSMRSLNKKLFPSAIAALLLTCTGCMTMEDIWPSFRRGERLRRPEPMTQMHQPQMQSQQLASPPVVPSQVQQPMSNEVTPLFPDPTTTPGQVPVVEVPPAVPHVPVAPQPVADPALSECRAQVDQLQLRIAQLEAESGALRSKADSSEVAMVALGDSMRRLSGEVEYWRKEVRRLEQKADQTHAEDMRALDELIEMLDAPKAPATSHSTTPEPADDHTSQTLPRVDE